MSEKKRLDQWVVDQGLVESRAKAQAHILAGEVSVNGQVVRKVSKQISAEAKVIFQPNGPQYVSRGGEKLAGALDHFQMDPKGWHCVDVGLSTGGFSDCLLKRGAAHIFAIDVGTDQLHPSLRDHPCLTAKESFHVQELRPELLGQPADLAVVDVSFISLKKVLPLVLPCLHSGGFLLALIKPQFEACAKELGKSGILKDEEKRRAILTGIEDYATFTLGLREVSLVDAILVGSKGNQETFLLGRKHS